MNGVEIKIESAEVRKLLGAASGDTALLYIYLKSGGEPAMAADALRINEQRFSCAASTLRQLGLWQEEKARFIPTGERPAYSETDVQSAIDRDREFRSLYGEVERLLGRALTMEELKIILSFTRYLGLPADVICEETPRFNLLLILTTPIRSFRGASARIS